MRDRFNIVLGVFCGLVVVAALAFGSYQLWKFERPPFPLEKLDQLHSGMDTNDVLKILGNAQSMWTRTNEFGQPYQEWAYSNSWSIVYIYFSPCGMFQSHRYDK